MQSYADTLAIGAILDPIQSRIWEYARLRDHAPTDGTYCDDVSPTSPDVARVRFARFVARALTDARERGMTDDDIAQATGVGASTFHRWQRGHFVRAPGLDRVRAFCVGLDIPARSALLALGLEDGRDDPAPEPVVDPDVRAVLRRLADPSVSDEDKTAIRAVLRMLARRTVQAQARQPHDQ